MYLPYISPISRLYLAYISPISPLYLPYISPGLVEGSAAVATAGMQLHYDGGGTREVLVTVHADVYAEVGLGLGLGSDPNPNPNPNPNRT